MPSARGVALFLHLLGIVTLFVAMGVLQRGGSRLRAAPTLHDVRLWLGLVSTTRRMFPAGLAMTLASGLYLGTSWGPQPWILVALVSVVVIALLGAFVVGRAMRAIGQRISPDDGSVDADLSLALNRPGLWTAATSSNGMALGVLWLMVNKPGWMQSVSVVAAGALVGAVIGSRLPRRTPAQDVVPMRG